MHRTSVCQTDARCELSCVSMHAVHQARGLMWIVGGWNAPYLAERALLAEELFGVEHLSVPGVCGCQVNVTADHSSMHVPHAVLVLRSWTSA